MKICEEMVKLREGLDKRNIAWVDKSDIYPKERIEMLKSKGFTEEQSDFTMYRTHFTYGGTNPITSEVSGDKLELMIDDNYPQGWLTAEDVLNIIDKA